MTKHEFDLIRWKLDRILAFNLQIRKIWYCYVLLQVIIPKLQT